MLSILLPVHHSNTVGCMSIKGALRNEFFEMSCLERMGCPTVIQWQQLVNVALYTLEPYWHYLGGRDPGFLWLDPAEGLFPGDSENSGG